MIISLVMIIPSVSKNKNLQLLQGEKCDWNGPKMTNMLRLLAATATIISVLDWIATFVQNESK